MEGPPSLLISPQNSEISLLGNVLSSIIPLRQIPVGEEIPRGVKTVYIDLTMDVYNTGVGPSFLFQLFSQLQKIFDSSYFDDFKIYLINHYPMKTNSIDVLRKSELLSQYIFYIKKFFKVNMIFVPHIISPKTMNKSSCPVNRMLRRFQQKKKGNLGWQNQSVFSLLYERDFLEIFLKDDYRIPNSDFYVPGVQLTLEEAEQKLFHIHHESLVMFDEQKFVKMISPPGIFSAENISEVDCRPQYDFEDMIIELSVI